jgi:tRNA threonylcarbamoyl adenosine modification protein YeaZ
MIVLALDTSTPAVTAGVARRSAAGLDVLAERVTVDARAHAERLTPNVLEVLADVGITFPEVDAVAVGCGPGPFTGLRVGMATAAAYGHALGVAVHGVCSLDAIGVMTSGDVLVVTDARRREVYWARYHDGVRIDGPAVNRPADVPVGSAAVVAGSPHHAAFFDLPRLEATYPTTAGLVRAVTDWTAMPQPLVPMYLRRPDAKTLAERAAAASPGRGPGGPPACRGLPGSGEREPTRELAR